MPEIRLTILHEVGLHARPAALFVQTANQFTSDIRITYGDKEANAKSILDLLVLGVEKRAVITVHAEGEDEAEALKALKALVERNFEENR